MAVDHLRDEVEVPPEPNPVTSARWVADDVKVLKYVDDGVFLEKINMETADEGVKKGKKVKTKHAVPSQNLSLIHI